MKKRTPIARNPKQANNPIVILLAAFPFYIGAIILLIHQGGGLAAGAPKPMGSGSGKLIPLSPGEVHAFGFLALGFAVAITWFYFYLRREIRLDREAWRRGERAR